MKFLNRFSDGTLRVIYTFIALYCLTFASILFIKTMFTDRMTTDDCLWLYEVNGKPLKGELVIDQIIPGGVSDKAGLKNGDVLISIDGLKFNDWKQAQEILNTFDEETPVTYTILRNGNLMNIQINVYKLFNLLYLIFSLLGMGFLFIGHLVGYSKPKELTSQLFFFLSCSASLAFSSVGTNFPINLYPIFLINLVVGQLCFYPLIVHFFMTYPLKIEKPYRKKLLVILYSIVNLFALFRIIFSRNDTDIKPINIIGIGIATIYTLLGIWFFLNSYKKIKDERQKKPLKIILYGFIAAVCGVIYAYSLPIFINKPSFLINPWFYSPIALVLALPVSFGFSIIKYRILDTEFMIKKGLVFGIITVFIVVMYLLLVLVLDSFFSQFMPENKQLLTISLIVIVTFSFDFVNKKAKEFVDKQFYRERYNYRKSLLIFSEELPYHDNMRKVIDSLGNSVKETMGIDKLTVWFSDLDYYKILQDEFGVSKSKEEVFHRGEKFDEAFSMLFQNNKDPKLLNDVHLQEMKMSEEHREIIRNENFMLSIPIFIKNNLIGAMNFGQKPSGKAYSDEDIDLLKTLASQAAISFENSRLQQEKISKQKIEEELQIARKIQMGLLPQKINSIDGIEISGFYNPATLIGGDFYDVIKLSDDKLLIIVADVSGKGIPAALYMSKIQAMIQFASKIFQSPKEILIEVNKQIHQKIDRKSFITSVIALFDMSKMSVKICRAGHNPVIYSVNGSFQLLKNKGMGLGLESDKYFEKHLEETEIKINHDNMFVFYSDGLTEAMNKKKEEFGTEKVLNIINQNRNHSCNVIQKELITSVNDFRGDAEQNDDITLVIAKITKNVL